MIKINLNFFFFTLIKINLDSNWILQPAVSSHSTHSSQSGPGTLFEEK